MRAVCQRVFEASVTVDGAVVGAIGPGLVVLLGVARGDTAKEASLVAAKVAALRIFENEHGKFDRSLVDVNGEALVVSQFTLIADTSKGTGRASPRPRCPATPSRSTSTSVQPWRQHSRGWPEASLGRGCRCSS